MKTKCHLCRQKRSRKLKRNLKFVFIKTPQNAIVHAMGIRWRVFMFIFEVEQLATRFARDSNLPHSQKSMPRQCGMYYVLIHSVADSTLFSCIHRCSASLSYSIESILNVHSFGRLANTRAHARVHVNNICVHIYIAYIRTWKRVKQQSIKSFWGFLRNEFNQNVALYYLSWCGESVHASLRHFANWCGQHSWKSPVRMMGNQYLYICYDGTYANMYTRAYLLHCIRACKRQSGCWWSTFLLSFVNIWCENMERHCAR